jgi:hypothetical protein
VAHAVLNCSLDKRSFVRTYVWHEMELVPFSKNSIALLKRTAPPKITDIEAPIRTIRNLKTGARMSHLQIPSVPRDTSDHASFISVTVPN